MTYDNSGNLTHENRIIAGTGGLVLAEYTYNGIGQRIKKTTGGVTTIYYHLNDHLGTPQKLINTSNRVVWAADYLPFGKVNMTFTDTASVQ